MSPDATGFPGAIPVGAVIRSIEVFGGQPTTSAGHTCVVIDEVKGGFGGVELIADALHDYLASPTEPRRRLLEELGSRLKFDGGDDAAEAVLCRVAIRGALQAPLTADARSGAEAARSFRFLLELAKGLLRPDSSALERVLLGLAVPLGRIDVGLVSGDQSKVIQVAARLASLADDVAATRALLDARRDDWPIEAAGEVVACALEVAEHQPLGMNLAWLQAEADRLASNPSLRSMTRERLARAAARVAEFPSQTLRVQTGDTTTDDTSIGRDPNSDIETGGGAKARDGDVDSERFMRLTETAEALLMQGDYAGAEAAAHQLLEVPPRVRMIGEGLSLLARLHRGVLDEEVSAAAEIQRLGALARMPELVASANRGTVAAPDSMLREVAAHALALRVKSGVRTAARALDAIAESRVLLVQLSGDGGTLQEAAQAIGSNRLGDAVVDDRAGAVDWVRDLSSTSRGSDGDAVRGAVQPNVIDMNAAGGRDGGVVHVAELSMARTGAVLAVTHLQANGAARGYTVGLAGSAARTLRRLLAEPRSAETLTSADVEQLTRCLFGGLDVDGAPLLVPSPGLWSVPFEALLPGANVAPSYGTWRRMVREDSRAPGPLRICFAGDDSLPGAAVERRVLRDLAESGMVDLAEASDLAAARVLLVDGAFDVLALALHGGGDGLSYSFHSAGVKVPLHELAGWRLPSVLVAANCWSGRTGARLNLTTLLTSVTSALVVGLWDLSDAVTGDLLSKFYLALAAASRSPQISDAKSFTAAPLTPTSDRAASLAPRASPVTAVTTAWAGLPEHARRSGLRLLTGPHS